MLGSSDVCATIGVKDMAVAQKFYEGTLGLEKSMESPAGIFYKSGKSGVFIYPTEFAGTNKATYVSWLIDDVKGTVDKLKDKGVTFEQYDNMPGVKREGDVHIMGELKTAWFTDPDGNILNLVNQIG